MTRPFILVQISDLHIGARETPSGRSASEGLAAALEALKARKPDVIIATGDLTNDAMPQDYAELARLLADAPAPVFLSPGNHDDRDALRAAFPNANYLPREGPLSFVIDDFPVRIIALDSTIPGEVGGEFTPAQARWLEAALSADRTRPAVVALHHPPFATYDRLFDTLGLTGSELLTQTIARHPQVLRVLCGHHHRAVFASVAHAPAIMAPSTAWTYGLALNAEDPVAPRTPEPCGFLLHVWKPDMGLSSHLFTI